VIVGEDQGVEESKGSDPVPVVDDVPGGWSDSDSEEDERPSRWGKAPSALPASELEDCPDLLPSWEEVEESEKAAEQIRRRRAEAQQPEPRTAAAVPMAPLGVGLSAGETLAWATKVATEAEEIINSTLLVSVATTLPMDMGMLPSRRAKNGWYPGIERDRKLVSQLDKMDFKMSRGGGWAKRLEYRSRLVTSGQWRGEELAPSPEWGEAEQVAWLATVKLELKTVKERMQGKVRKQRKEAIEGYIRKRRAHFDAGRVVIMVDSVFGRRMGLG
jgi:hypothetical protein